MKIRDWITVTEYAARRGEKTINVHMRIRRRTFPDLYEQTESGLILIYAPQKTKARQQVNFPQTACDHAGDR